MYQLVKNLLNLIGKQRKKPEVLINEKPPNLVKLRKKTKRCISFLSSEEYAEKEYFVTL